MSLPRVRYLLAGLLGGFVAAPMVVAATWSLDLAGGFAAVGLIDILLGVLGLMLSTLTAIAGALVVADVRADVDAARAWQGIKVEVTAVGKPADTAPAGPFDAHYVVGQQDEGLRRILLAHRFDVPLPALKDTALSAPASAGATGSAGLAGTCVDKKPTTARELMAAVTPLDAMASPERNLSDRAPRLIASKPNRQEHSIDVRGMRQRDMRCAMRATTKMRLVANAGRSSKWTEHSTVASHGGPARGFAAEVIFLAADRNVSDRDRARPDSVVGATAPAQPGCRGPPAGGSQRQAAFDPASGPGSVGKRHRPPTDTLTAPAGVVVVDNLGDPVPVGAAELDVVETYLDDMLRELLAAVASGQDGQTS